MNFLRKPFTYSFSNVTLIIIAINIGVYFLSTLMPVLKFLFSLRVRSVIENGMYWQFFTYMFMHASPSHVIFNMLGLFFFGLSVERSIGSKEFLLLYMISGIFCGILTFVVYYFTGRWSVFLLGASGALYAILFAFAVLFPRSNIYVWGILPVPSPLMVLIYGGISLFSLQSQDGVAHFTHFAGFILSWVYLLVRMGVNPIKVWINAYR
ncbi:MAG: rhomboid family intramembrane serine protease [Treponemataceae bacterium]